ncbi:MAG TPA: hypothetical protein VKT29_02080, partial [Terriglobales bacterium]|nr:hypothetical protein [Terriglobales bacterium]
MTTRTSQFPIVTPAAYRGPADQASLTKLKWGFRVGAVLLAAASNWVNRFAMGVDGISYLDMAYAYMRGQWKIAINPYWGAGYSWLLGAFLVPFHVSPYWESTVVHLVNVLVFVLALFAFEYLLAGVIQYRSLSRFSGTGLDPWTWWTIGYVLFLAVHTFLVPVTGVTPDLCVDVILFVAAGIIVRIASGSDTLRAYTVLGAILALGYLIKAPMFPMGLVFLAAGWLASPRRRQALARSAVGCAVFLLLCSPFILAISLQLGRPTIGEAGRVTYAHYALGVNDVSYWQGQYAGMGTPRHPDATRKLMDNPDVYA